MSTPSNSNDATHQKSRGNCIPAPIRFVWLFFWPIIAILLGLVCGAVFGIVITLAVFGLTLVRTPMHIAKMMYVTATTKECFKGHLARPMRIAVLLWVPVVHIVFLVGITLFSATVGMLYYIGKATKVFYNHEYVKTAKKIESNARLEPKSYFGKYYKKCQEFMAEDKKSHPTIYFLKGCCAIVPGVLLGAIPFIPFSLAILAITLYRLPINFYKTMKIALFTVVLKWDLKIIAFFTLPIIHTLFPLVVFIGAVVGSFAHAAFQTTANIFEGDSPFHEWGRFRTGLDDYYKAHQQFVSEQCGNYDHPTGIPLGWNGSSYGIPIQRIMKWQWDFLMMCVFTVYAVPICLSGSTVIAVLKYIPICFFLASEMTTDYCEGGCATMLGFWPFFVVGLCLIPAGTLLVLVLLVVGFTLMVLKVPVTYLEDGYYAAAYEPFSILHSLDEMTEEHSFGCYVFPCLNEHDENPYSHGEGREISTRGTEARERAGAYWDRFVSQSIQTTAMLLTEKQWITLEDVQTFDPAVVQSIPAVAILKVIADSIHEPGLKDDDFAWKIDGTTCKQADRPSHDGIIHHLLPLVLEIKKLLSSNKKELVNAENMEWLMAMFCANNEDDTEELKSYLQSKVVSDNKTKAAMGNVRTKINNLVLAILRVKPYQDRMSRIYEYEYGGEADEDGAANDTGTLSVVRVSNPTSEEPKGDGNSPRGHDNQVVHVGANNEIPRATTDAVDSAAQNADTASRDVENGGFNARHDDASE